MRIRHGRRALIRFGPGRVPAEVGSLSCRRCRSQRGRLHREVGFRVLRGPTVRRQWLRVPLGTLRVDEVNTRVVQFI